MPFQSELHFEVPKLPIQRAGGSIVINDIKKNISKITTPEKPKYILYIWAHFAFNTSGKFSNASIVRQLYIYKKKNQKLIECYFKLEHLIIC